ncbi:ethylene-responsive transcription factor erf086 [Quercus suber]|uniref:Ethylene-responsive transcription factor erf086 n=1 Tax=Quercus suber TaxID=58331 RepID=A0AAW0LGN4_QUESU
MSTSKTLDKPFQGYEAASSQVQNGFALIQRNTSPSQPGERRGRRKQAEPGRFLGVRRRPWVVPTSSQFLTTSTATTHTKQPTNIHQSSTPSKLNNCTHSESETSTQLNNNTWADTETSYGVGVADDNSFFFSNESNSGYLGCIVPDNCLRPSSNPTSTNSKYSNFTTSNDSVNTNSIEIQSHCDSHTLPFDLVNVPAAAATASNYPGDFSCLDELNHGFWDIQQSWESNSSELSAMINNPLMVEDGCMGALYPIIDNPSYGLIMPQAVASSTTSSPSVSPYSDVVDLGYSLF